MRSLQTPDTSTMRSTWRARHQASEVLFVFTVGHGTPMELGEKVANFHVMSSPPLHRNKQFL